MLACTMLLIIVNIEGLKGYGIGIIHVEYMERIGHTDAKSYSKCNHTKKTIID
jgi:hypothetical protein